MTVDPGSVTIFVVPDSVIVVKDPGKVVVPVTVCVVPGFVMMLVTPEETTVMVVAGMVTYCVGPD